jgi:hypothetical protein
MALSPAPVPVSRAHPAVKAALAATFPNYRGRKVRVALWTAPLHLDLNWSGGTKDTVVLIDMANSRVGRLVVPSPWARGAADPVDCPPDAVLAVHSYFCGVDAGVTFYVRPGSSAGLLGA